MDLLFTVGAYVLLAMSFNTLRIQRQPDLIELGERYGVPRGTRTIPACIAKVSQAEAIISMTRGLADELGLLSAIQRAFVAMTSFTLSRAPTCFRRRRLCRREAEAAIKDHGDWTIEIIKRSDIAKSFVLLPRRWVYPTYSSLW